MSDRITALTAALDAQAGAATAASTIAALIKRNGSSAPEEMAGIWVELDTAAANLLLAAEQMRSAVHKFSEVAEAHPDYGILRKH